MHSHTWGIHVKPPLPAVLPDGLSQAALRNMHRHMPEPGRPQSRGTATHPHPHRPNSAGSEARCATTAVQTVAGARGEDKRGGWDNQEDRGEQMELNVTSTAQSTGVAGNAVGRRGSATNDCTTSCGVLGAATTTNNCHLPQLQHASPSRGHAPQTALKVPRSGQASASYVITLCVARSA